MNRAVSRPLGRGWGRRRGAILALALLLCASPLLAGGCWGRAELRELIFVGVIGLDKGPQEGWLRVTILTTTPAAAGGAGAQGGGRGAGGGGAGTPPPVVTATEEGPSLFAATLRLNTVASRVITYDHAQILLIGEELAREGISPFMDTLHRSKEFRRNLPVAVAGGVTAEEFLRRVRPDVERSPSEYLAGLIRTAQQAFSEAPPGRVHELDLAYVSPSREIALPLLALVPKPPIPQPPGQGGGGGGGEGGGGGGGGGDQETPPTETRAAVAGTALFRGERMVAHLDPGQTQGYLLVQGRFSRAIIPVSGPATQDTTATFELSRYSRRVSVRRNGEQVSLDIRVKVTAELIDVAGPAQIAGLENRPALGRLVAAELERRMTEVINLAKTEVGGDPFGLSLFVRPTFSTWPEWMEFDWNRAFCDAEISVGVKVVRIRSDLIFQPPVPRN